MGIFTKKEKTVQEEHVTPVNAEFRFADPVEQLMRTNNFMVLANTAY